MYNVAHMEPARLRQPAGDTRLRQATILKILLLISVVVVLRGVAPRSSLMIALSVFTLVCGTIIYVASKSRNFLHPLVAFTIFFYMYSTWYTYQSLFDSTVDPRLLQRSLEYGLAGILSFTLGVHIQRFMARRSIRPRQPFTRLSTPPERILFLTLAAISITSHAIVYAGGFTSKREVMDSEGLFVTLAAFSLFVCTVLAFIRMARSPHRILRDRYGYLVLVLTMLAFAIKGERDYLLRFVFGAMCVWLDFHRKARFSVVIAIAAGTAFIMPILQALKAFAITTETSPLVSGTDTFFTNEYTAASRNLYLILLYEPVQSWRYLISDIVRGVLPFGNQLGLRSTSAWYNAIFRFDHNIHGTSGWGFSLVAQGYMIGGLLGISLLFLSLGFFLHWAYRKRWQSEFWYAFYLIAISNAIYCIRADIANVISQTFKVGGLAILATYLVDRAFRSPRPIRHQIDHRRQYEEDPMPRI